MFLNVNQFLLAFLRRAFIRDWIHDFRTLRSNTQWLFYEEFSFEIERMIQKRWYRLKKKQFFDCVIELIKTKSCWQNISWLYLSNARNHILDNSRRRISCRLRRQCMRGIFVLMIQKLIIMMSFQEICKTKHEIKIIFSKHFAKIYCILNYFLKIRNVRHEYIDCLFAKSCISCDFFYDEEKSW
jgi:hypothetical protein